MPRILAFAGSTRNDSFNALLVRVASAAAREAGADVTDINLRDFPMPLLDQDFEAEHGKPDAAKRLTQLMVEHEGFLIASPEYNSSISGVLKNAIDWASRPDDENSAPLAAFQGKVVTLMSASPGGLRRLARPRARARNPRQYRLHRAAGSGRDLQRASSLQR